MLDIQYIRQYPELVQQNADKRGVKVNMQLLLHRDEALRNRTQELDTLRADRNSIAAQMQQTGGKNVELIEQGKLVKVKIAEIEQEVERLREEFQALMMQVPNMTHPDSPIGKNDLENVEIRRFQEPTEFSFPPKDHVELGKSLDLIDFERGADVAGKGFYYLKNEAVLLELALVNYAMDTCMAEGFMPMMTPDLAYSHVLAGTGFAPRGPETQIYNLENTNLSLIATAEIGVAGYYQNHLFAAGELDQPLKIVALSHCFRTEAGSYGRESRGLYRVHQFTKVEMFIYSKPEDSEAMHQHLLEVEEKIMQHLEIPYRVVDICTGDLGGAAYRKYDVEAWMPFKQDWGEVTSTSNCTDYQARRLNIKYVNAEGKKEYVHTLNGTAIALSRTPIAVLENFQQADGSIKIPQVLHPYMFGKTMINRR
ncbi:MAG: serine--tRNA ligase [Candidatus Kerfeldbacteria bacterium]|nr:serine--tRNA ligase [Candidatus Kerfeldbacteria bacterium]